MRAESRKRSQQTFGGTLTSGHSCSRTPPSPRTFPSAKIGLKSWLPNGVSAVFWPFRVDSVDSVCSWPRPGVSADNRIRRFAGTFTGATGLEPATSGVTGRHGATGYSWLRPGITGYSRHFIARRTGCDRLRPAATRHSLCGICVVAVVAMLATIRR